MGHGTWQPLIPALTGVRAEHSIFEGQYVARPFASVIQTTTVRVGSIRQENPTLVDEASITTRL